MNLFNLLSKLKYINIFLAQPSPASKPHSEPLPASGKPNAIKEQEWDDEDEKEFGTGTVTVLRF